MKGIGKKILTALVALLLLAVPFAIAWGVTNGMNHGTKSMTMTEARELVAKVFSALENNRVNNSVSPATVEEYYADEVVLDDMSRNMCLQPLLIAKLVIEDVQNGAREGYLHSSVTETDHTDGAGHALTNEYKVAVKLVDHGLVIDMIGYSYYTDEDKAPSRLYLNLFYVNDNNKDFWYYELSYLDINHEFANYDHSNDTKNFIQMVVGGVDNKVTYADSKNLSVNQTFYGETLNKENVVSAFSGKKNANEAFCFSTGPVSSEYWGEHRTFEDQDLNDFVDYCQSYVMKAYSPVFDNINFVESNFMSKFNEQYHSL